MILIKLLEFAIRRVLFSLQIAIMLSIFIGIPSAPLYFAWFIIERLSTELPKELAYQAPEAVVCLIFHTMFFFIVLWGLLPYYSMRPEIPFFLRGLISCSFGLLTEALTITALHVAFISWNWSAQFEASETAGLASRCRAITVFLVVLWSVGWGAFLIFLSVAIDFGTPSWIRQMLADMRKLMAVLHIQSKADKDGVSISAKNTMMESDV